MPPKVMGAASISGANIRRKHITDKPLGTPYIWHMEALNEGS